MKWEALLPQAGRSARILHEGFAKVTQTGDGHPHGDKDWKFCQLSQTSLSGCFVAFTLFSLTPPQEEFLEVPLPF